MPQMSPISWNTWLMMSTMIIITMMTKMYFSTEINKKKMKETKKKKLNYWKW
nr:ATP synthase F0 subunit 8 [Dichoptera sp. WW-2021a]